MEPPVLRESRESIVDFDSQGGSVRWSGHLLGCTGLGLGDWVGVARSTCLGAWVDAWLDALLDALQDIWLGAVGRLDAGLDAGLGV